MSIKQKSLITALLLLVGAATASSALPRTNPDALEPYVGSQRIPASAPAMTFMNDGKSYAALTPDRKKIVQIDMATGNEIATLLDVATTRENKIERIDNFTISDNGAMILVATSVTPIYRRSTTAVHYLYETRSRILRPLSEEHSPQRAPLFSPDGMMVAFVGTDNNIYLKKLNYWTEVAVTTDGAVNQIINGVPDWTYEEEFTTASSMAWAPDSRTLCYIRYDESEVPTYSLTLYEGSCDPRTEFALYPGQYTYKYPVAGEKNSTVSIHSYDVDNRKTKDLPLPAGPTEYIPRIAFAGNPDQMMAVTLNRAQNRMEIFSVNPRSAVAKSLLVEQSSAWLNPSTYEDITWQDDSFVILSGRSGYDHLYRYSYTGALLGQLTSGNFDVTAYYGFDPRQDDHYYQSTSTGSINRVISRIDRKGKVTDITPAAGTANARFTPTMDRMVLSYSNASTPPVISVADARTGKQLRVLADNTKGDYAARYSSIPRREFLQIPADGGVMLNAYLIKPTDFNPSRRYPVIIYQYSGPGSQQVADSWSVDWMNYYATQGYVIACVDGRGTGFRGREFQDVVYRNLGYWETRDMISSARWLASQPWVDGDHIGIHGWSFGGYETLMCVSDPESPFAAGVSVAPVTDWRFYDTIYAERYMLTPGENADGYKSSSVLGRVANIKCPLLVMYGTADDNVHPENSVALVAELEGAGNYCDLLLFPNMNHSINGCGIRKVVYARMLDYFNASLR
ncbi:MAG: S9 family peptidase [Clostridium sp.]|nr:S9 family peptidase [Clostridium sp.]